MIIWRKKKIFLPHEGGGTPTLTKPLPSLTGCAPPPPPVKDPGYRIKVEIIQATVCL